MRFMTMLAELEVHRTIQREEPWAFTMSLAGLIDGPSTIHMDNVGINDGMWRGEEGCCGAKQKDADLSRNNWELSADCAENEWDLDLMNKHSPRKELRIR